MSRDSEDSVRKQVTYFGFRHLKLQSKERIHYPTDEGRIVDRETMAASHGSQRYFYADSKSCEVQSNDPSDLYRALDITFKAKTSIFGRFMTAVNTLLGYNFEADDATVLVSNERNRFSKCSSKPRV